MKMRNATLICFVLMLADTASAQTKESDREFEGLKRKGEDGVDGKNRRDYESW